jgi:hypothetical protein
MFVWAFSGNEKESKSNFFKATLIMAGVVVLLQIFLFLFFGFALLSN